VIVNRDLRTPFTVTHSVKAARALGRLNDFRNLFDAGTTRDVLWYGGLSSVKELHAAVLSMYVSAGDSLYIL
jgi:hypothetical protein